MSKSLGSVQPSRTMVIVTLVPGLPRMRLTASASCMSLVDEAVDLDDAVAGLQPGPVGRRALDRRHDRQDVVPQRDLDAETAEAARGLDLHLPVAVRVEEGAVRVEAAQRALDGVVDQILRRDLVHVLVLDDGEDLGEQPELLVGGAVVRALAGDGAAERQREHHEQRADHERLLHGFPLEHPTQPRCRSHCSGSWGLP